jgi:hypothetical protein
MSRDLLQREEVASLSHKDHKFITGGTLRPYRAGIQEAERGGLRAKRV